MTMEEKSPPSTMDLSTLSKSRDFNWPAILFYIHVHLISLFGIWLLIFEAKILTIFFLILLVSIPILGVTAGAHRLWAHSTYQASTGLRIMLMLFQTLAGQGTIYDWVQHHRLHHAYFKTDSDPHNSKKGFLYAHFFTRLQNISPYTEALKNSIDMSDIEKDEVVMFQKRFYWILYGIFFVLLPLNAPPEYWEESILCTAFVIGGLRYGIILHTAWLLESGICIWGLQEGEKYPPDSNTVFILNRSYWPEYHYIYPQDYKSGEFGSYGSGCSTAFIRVFAALGLANKLLTLESKTLQHALTEAVKTERPLSECLQRAVQNHILPEDHFLKVK